MERIDIERLIAAKFAYEEAYNAAFSGTHERVTTTSIVLPTRAHLRAVSDATGVAQTVYQQDASGNPTSRKVDYGGCTFFCHETDPVVGGGNHGQ